MSDDASATEHLAARLSQFAESGVRRVNLEVAGEQVTYWVRYGRLHESCTCGSDHCEHLAAALQFLAAGSGHVEARRSSVRPPPSEPEHLAIADAFDELCLATARAGIAPPESPSIKQALAQLLAAVPDPVPLSIARWVGRFHEARASGDLGEIARLLDGALQWAEELRANPGSFESLANRRAWLSPNAGEVGAESLAEVTLLEVAREWVTGLDRASIERRYLLDLGGGEVLTEERRRGDVDISLGPCPRIAHVAFAELEPTTRPPRVRLLQYTLSVQLTEEPWQRVVQLADTEVAALRERYVADLRASPGLAEPFAIFAPTEVESSPQGALRDSRGERLPVRGEQGLPSLDTLLAACRGGDLVCVLGRLLGHASGIVLQPLSAIVRRGAWLELRRVT